MSEQENETPVWHAIVGDGWEPVQFRAMTRPDEEVLLAGGCAVVVDVGGFIYHPDMQPRRRRIRSYGICSRRDGRPFNRVNTARPGDCFMLTDNGELIPVDKPPTQSAE
jgi:hypothetical protein